MIQSKTARKIMYDWHNGQTCPLYAAASSGLVENWDALMYACSTITETPDREKLIEWVKNKKDKQKFSVIVRGSSYAVLPWVGRSY